MTADQGTQPHAPATLSLAALAALAVLAVALAALLLPAAGRSRPALLADAPQGRLPCLSYAPFRRDGATPFDPALIVSPQRIEEDLRLVARISGCVRTYGLDHGLDAVPGIARRLGLRVMLGAWIGRDAAANVSQLERAIALARSHADVIDLLIVGNEVLLRRELAPEALAALLARARRESGIPVAYADVWEFWLRHAHHLRAHVDVVAAHVLPYWEDEPVAVADAVSHVYAVAARMRERFAPLPVIVAETGWPAAGRQRGPAVPGTVEQLRFVRELQARGAVEPLRFNLIEAFDQPWKRALEGAMGGAWGVFDAGGVQRVTFAGPVPARPQSLAALALACLGAAAGAIAAVRRRRARRSAVVLAAALAGTATAAMLGLQADALQVWSRTPLEWVAGAIALLAGIALSTLAAHRLCDTLEAAPAAPRRGACEALRSPGERAFAFALLAWLFIVLTQALGLVFDARYRALPWEGLALPAALLVGLALLGDRSAADAREERVLAAIGIVCAAAIAWQEGFANLQAQAYAGCLLVACVAVAWPHRGESGVRTSTSAATSTAGAAVDTE
jgi:glucan 1,3-beta-glucosidase